MLIVVYAGITADFAWFWVLLTAVLEGSAVLIRYGRNHPGIFPGWLGTVIMVAVLIGSVCFGFICSRVISGMKSSGKKNLDYVVVLGAHVKGDVPSKALELRLKAALKYARENEDTILVLSGGQGDDEDVTEASAMYRYMKSRGVPDYQLLLEESSRSTYENMVYSKILITERERLRRATLRAAMAEYGYLLPPDEEITIRVGILTSNFHELRAKGIARHVGIPNVSGISAKSDPVLFAHFCVRECFAILKDKFVGNM